MLFRQYRRTIQKSIKLLLLISFLFLCCRIYFYLTLDNLASDPNYVLPESRNSVERKHLASKRNKNKYSLLHRKQEMVEKMKHSLLKPHAVESNSQKVIVKITEDELFRRLRSSDDGISKDPLVLDRLKVCENNNTCLPFPIYKEQKFKKFVFDVNKHLNHSRIPPTLKPYPVNKCCYYL